MVRALLFRSARKVNQRIRDTFVIVLIDDPRRPHSDRVNGRRLNGAMVRRRSVRATRLRRVVWLRRHIRDLERLDLLTTLHAISSITRLRRLHRHTVLPRSLRRRPFLALLLRRLGSRRGSSRDLNLLLLPPTTTLRLRSDRGPTLRNVRALRSSDAAAHERRRSSTTHNPSMFRRLAILSMSAHRLVADRDGWRRWRMHTVASPRLIIPPRRRADHV